MSVNRSKYIKEAILARKANKFLKVSEDQDEDGTVRRVTRRSALSGAINHTWNKGFQDVIYLPSLRIAGTEDLIRQFYHDAFAGFNIDGKNMLDLDIANAFDSSNYDSSDKQTVVVFSEDPDGTLAYDLFSNRTYAQNWKTEVDTYRSNEEKKKKKATASSLVKQTIEGVPEILKALGGTSEYAKQWEKLGHGTYKSSSRNTTVNSPKNATVVGSKTVKPKGAGRTTLFNKDKYLTNIRNGTTGEKSDNFYDVTKVTSTGAGASSKKKPKLDIIYLGSGSLGRDYPELKKAGFVPSSTGYNNGEGVINFLRNWGLSEDEARDYLDSLNNARSPLARASKGTSNAARSNEPSSPKRGTSSERTGRSTNRTAREAARARSSSRNSGSESDSSVRSGRSARSDGSAKSGGSRTARGPVGRRAR